MHDEQALQNFEAEDETLVKIVVPDWVPHAFLLNFALDKMRKLGKNYFTLLQEQPAPDEQEVLQEYYTLEEHPRNEQINEQVIHQLAGRSPREDNLAIDEEVIEIIEDDEDFYNHDDPVAVETDDHGIHFGRATRSVDHSCAGLDSCFAGGPRSGGGIYHDTHDEKMLKEDSTTTVWAGGKERDRRCRPVRSRRSSWASSGDVVHHEPNDSTENDPHRDGAEGMNQHDPHKNTSYPKPRRTSKSNTPQKTKSGGRWDHDQELRNCRAAEVIDFGKKPKLPRCSNGKKNRWFDTERREGRANGTAGLKNSNLPPRGAENIKNRHQMLNRRTTSRDIFLYLSAQQGAFYVRDLENSAVKCAEIFQQLQKTATSIAGGGASATTTSRSSSSKMNTKGMKQDDAATGAVSAHAPVSTITTTVGGSRGSPSPRNLLKNKSKQLILKEYGKRDEFRIASSIFRKQFQFQEPEICFLPSYKFKKTEQYSTERAPSWCDRVLYYCKGDLISPKNDYRGFYKYNPFLYRAVENAEVLQSDHRAVIQYGKLELVGRRIMMAAGDVYKTDQSPSSQQATSGTGPNCGHVAQINRTRSNHVERQVEQRRDFDHCGAAVNEDNSCHGKQLLQTGELRQGSSSTICENTSDKDKGGTKIIPAVLGTAKAVLASTCPEQLHAGQDESGPRTGTRLPKYPKNVLGNNDPVPPKILSNNSNNKPESRNIKHNLGCSTTSEVEQIELRNRNPEINLPTTSTTTGRRTESSATFYKSPLITVLK
ncbi:unnamed protein product [Amoebophrya sp. A120]|nr:unnamed protein product [Amoebophrya sp. A120]|eukprot:GSA120T00010011001.1